MLKGETVVRIPNHYISNNCAQIMKSYVDEMMIISPKGIVFCDLRGEDIVNSYINDKRRRFFPYHNIPTHIRKRWFNNSKYKITNQLIDFDTPYLVLSSELQPTELYAIKNGYRHALLLNKLLYPHYMEAMQLSKQELHDFFEQPTVDNEKQCILVNGSINFGNVHFDIDPLSLDKTFQSSFVDTIYGAPLLSRFIMINTDNENITMRSVSVRFIDENNYKVDVCNFPINKYTLDELRDWVKIHNVKEPKISPKLNPNVDLNHIKEGKEVVKMSKKLSRTYQEGFFS